jgi:hypothetical protein
VAMVSRQSLRCSSVAIDPEIVFVRRRINRIGDDAAARVIVATITGLDMTLLLWTLHVVADLFRMILFVPDPFRRLLRSSVRNARICSSSGSCQPTQPFERP